MISEIFITPVHAEMKTYFSECLADRGQVRRFRKGVRISETEFEGYIKIVLKGLLKIGIVSEDGQYRLLHLIRPGEAYDEFPEYGEIGLDVIAKEETEMLFFPFEEIGAMPDPVKAMSYLLYSMHRKYALLMFQALSVQFDDVSGRIASLIIRTAYQGQKRTLDGKYTLDYGFTHDEMACIIGCSRVTVTRHLQEFKEKGLLDYQRQYIVINDMGALEKFTAVK